MNSMHKKIQTWLNRIDLTVPAVTEFAIYKVQQYINEYIYSESDSEHKINELGIKIPLSLLMSRESLFNLCQMYFGVQGYTRLIYDFTQPHKSALVQYFYGLSLKPEIALQTYNIFVNQLHTIRVDFYNKNLKNEKSTNITSYRLDRFCDGFLRNFYKPHSKLPIPKEEQQQLERYRVNAHLKPLIQEVEEVSDSVEERSQKDFEAGINYFKTMPAGEY